jgi:hypothetical protein
MSLPLARPLHAPCAHEFPSPESALVQSPVSCVHRGPAQGASVFLRAKLSLRTSPLGAVLGAEADGFSGASPAAPSGGCFCFCTNAFASAFCLEKDMARMRPPTPDFFGSCVGAGAGAFGTPSDAGFLSSAGAARLNERLRRRPPELVPFLSSGAASPAVAEAAAAAVPPSPPDAFATPSDAVFLRATGSAEAALLKERLRRRPPELVPLRGSGACSPSPEPAVAASRLFLLLKLSARLALVP